MHDPEGSVHGIVNAVHNGTQENHILMSGSSFISALAVDVIQHTAECSAQPRNAVLSSCQGDCLQRSLNVLKIICCCVGLIVNTLEVFIFLSKELRSRSGIILALISCFHWITVFTALYLHILLHYLRDIVEKLWYRDYLICPFWVLQSISYSSSIYLIVLLSFERFIVVFKPIRHRNLFGPRYTAFVGLLIALLSISFVFVRWTYMASYFSFSAHVGAILIWLIVYTLVPSTFLFYTSAKLVAVFQRRHAILNSSSQLGKRTADNLGAIKIVVFVAVLQLGANAVPRIVILIYKIGYLVGSGVHYNIIFQNILTIFELLSFVSLDCVVYFNYNRAYREKLTRIAKILDCCGSKILRLNSTRQRQRLTAGVSRPFVLKLPEV